MKTYNKKSAAVSQLMPEQYRPCSKTDRNDRFKTNTGTTKCQGSMSMWCRASHRSRPSINSTAAPAGRASQSLLNRRTWRSEEHTSELQSLMRISYAVFCLKKKKHNQTRDTCMTNRINRRH